ncbi:MAG: hypothetical protein OEW58_08215 [Gammaproteobacteria bacterium]|nr:hypothetical protein [Gammaproteobacteria bacterium]
MLAPFHLLATVSAHGYGHFAQTALVLNELRERYSQLRITLRTKLPEALVKSRLGEDVQVLAEVADFGMDMTSALDIDYSASAERYRQWHRHWAERVTEESQRLRALKPDLVLANAPYLTLAGAHQAGLASVAMCSLNWADIYRDCFAETADSRAIHQQMLEAYNRARWFFKPQPSMAMADLVNGVDVPPLAKLGSNQREWLNCHWGLGEGERLVFIVPGGIETAIPLERWPRIDGVRWVASWLVHSDRPDVLCAQHCLLTFTDLLASCDLVVTKPGYGTTTEAVCNGKPVLFVCRGDWAEEPFIVDWLLRHGQAQEISREQFFSGELRDAIEQVLNTPKPAIPEPSGARLIADHLAQFF